MPQPKDKDWLNGYKNKTTTYICCLQETHLKPRDTYRLNVMGWKNIFHANGDQKKAGVAILISDKIDFEIKALTRALGKVIVQSLTRLFISSLVKQTFVCLPVHVNRNNKL